MPALLTLSFFLVALTSAYSPSSSSYCSCCCGCFSLSTDILLSHLLFNETRN
jgi:hypothetical protein